MQNAPLEQWQIDHILKMQQELGSPDTEEDTMDGDTMGEDLQGGLPQAADAADAAGALSVYKDPNVLKAQTEYDTLAKKQTERYDALERAIAEKRYAPSFSERMFQLSAALAAPTSRRGFGGILENISPVLAAQQKAQREGEISRKAALDKLDADRLAQQVGLAKQGLTTSLAMAKINAEANKPVRGVPVGDTLRNPYTGAIMEPPPPPVGTTKVFEGRQYTFIGGDQYDKNNWKVVK